MIWRNVSRSHISDSVREPTSARARTYVHEDSRHQALDTDQRTKNLRLSLKVQFWAGLHEFAKSRKTTAAKLVGEIERQRTTVNLSSAIRIYVYNYFRSIEGEHAEANPAQHQLDGQSLRAQADKYRGLTEGLKDKETRTSCSQSLRITADGSQHRTIGGANRG